MSSEGKYLRPRRGVSRSAARKKRGYTLIIIISAVVVIASVALVIWFYNVMTAPDQFTPRHLRLNGAVFSNQQLIADTVNRTIGTNMLLADLDAVCDEVEKLPWVKRVSARKIIPDTLELTLMEQRPAAFAVVEGSLLLVDQTGEVIEPMRPELPFDDLPLITGLDGLEPQIRELQIRTGVQLIRTITGRQVWAERLLEVDVSEIGSERVHLADAVAPIILGPENTDQRLTRYFFIEAALRERYVAVEYVDVRFAGQVVINGTGNRFGQE